MMPRHIKRNQQHSHPQLLPFAAQDKTPGHSWMGALHVLSGQMSF
jgi:hypothetical protein